MRQSSLRIRSAILQRIGRSGGAGRCIGNVASASHASNHLPISYDVNPQLLQSQYPVGFTRNFATESDEAAEAPKKSMDDQQLEILSASLDQVHEFGWTDDAIAAGVLELNLPPSMVGLVSGGPSQLISFFMDQCNGRLEAELRERYVPIWDKQKTPIPERIHQAIWCRLEMVGPYIRSGRWQEGMALGAMPPNNMVTTAGQLSHLTDLIVSSVGLPSISIVERAAIGGVYAATELHMLTDTSPGFEDTAIFLEHRVRELETMAGAVSSMGTGGPELMSPKVAVAATSVVSSLGGAIVSLAQPAALGAFSTVASQVVPQVTSFMTSQSLVVDRPTPSEGTSVNDYGDLPPFESETAEGKMK